MQQKTVASQKSNDWLHWLLSFRKIFAKEAPQKLLKLLQTEEKPKRQRLD